MVCQGNNLLRFGCWRDITVPKVTMFLWHASVCEDAHLSLWCNKQAARRLTDSSATCTATSTSTPAISHFNRKTIHKDKMHRHPTRCVYGKCPYCLEAIGTNTLTLRISTRDVRLLSASLNCERWSVFTWLTD